MSEHQLRLAADPTSPAIARRLAREQIADCDDETTWTVELLVSEVVGNAVVHGASHVDVFWQRDDGTLRVEVVDYGGGVPVMLEPPVWADRGRGLLLVNSLAEQWGVTLEDTRKAVWFEVPLTPPCT